MGQRHQKCKPHDHKRDADTARVGRSGRKRRYSIRLRRHGRPNQVPVPDEAHLGLTIIIFNTYQCTQKSKILMNLRAIAAAKARMDVTKARRGIGTQLDRLMIMDMR